MRNPGVDQNFTDLAAVVQLRLRVALGLQTLTVKSRLLINRRELGANPRRPTISASVVKLLSSSASNGEFAGGSLVGWTNSSRVSPTTRDAPLRTRGWGWKSLTRHQFPSFPAPASRPSECVGITQLGVNFTHWLPFSCSYHRVSEEFQGAFRCTFSV